jgi:hypothetical protein
VRLLNLSVLCSARVPQTDLSAAPDWTLATLPWLLAAILVACIVGAIAMWMLVQRAGGIERLRARLDVLDNVHAALAKMLASRDDLDLRRLEHVLIELRDGQRRLEDALLRAVATRRTPELLAGPTSPPGTGAELAERVENRLLALGYERIAIVTGAADLDEIARAGGEVLVEARRDGVPCKGKLTVRGGALTEVSLQPAFATFP